MNTCESCGAVLGIDGVFSGKQSRLTPAQIEFINEKLGLNLTAGCTKCTKKEASKAYEIGRKEYEMKSKEFLWKHSWLPMTSSGVSSNWEFEVIDLVTAQSNLGTGVLINITSDIRDLFGMQSGSYNTKMAEAERLCKVGLISKALELDADAIIGIDIDYQEVGGGKGILMVCMTGTAVRLKDTKVLSKESTEKLINTKKHFSELIALKAIGSSFHELLNPFPQQNPISLFGQDSR